jgi:hypothetical protein
MTPPRKEELEPVTSNGHAEEPETFFVVLYRPTPHLGRENAELAFVEKASGSHPYTIWTRAGKREGVSEETWDAVYDPHSQSVSLPANVEGVVRSAYRNGIAEHSAVRGALQSVFPGSTEWISARAGEGRSS